MGARADECEDEPMRPLKDDAQERPIPDAWRSTLAAIADSIPTVDGSPIGAGLPRVEPISEDLSSVCREAITRYGEVTLVPLPEDTWDTSVYLWQGDRWSCLIDLWTRQEGRSDLVLDVDVFEEGEDYRFTVNLIYVP